MKILSKIILILFVFGMIPEYIKAEGRSGESGSLLYSFVEIVDDTEIKPVDLTTNPPLPLGRPFIFFFQPLKNAYIYLFKITEDSNITILFPGTFDQFRKKYFSFKHFLPVKLSTENPEKSSGNFSLHLVISNKRLTKVEELVREYRALSSGQSDARKTIGYEILIEVRRIKREFAFEKIIEEPVYIAGTFRSENDQMIEEAAIKIKFDYIYTKVFEFESR